MLTAVAALMRLGDLVRLLFLKAHGFTVPDTPPAVLFGLVLAHVIGYLAIVILEYLG